MLIAKNIISATFLERPNRFLVIVRLNNENIKCYIPDPGRAEELLIPNKRVWLVKSNNQNRKTSYDLIAVQLEEKIISIDSRIPNKLVFNLLKEKILFNYEFDEIKPEFVFNKSRLDFFLRKNETRFLVEVKSCTLVKNRTALFPDAPTKRGARHVIELIDALNKGYKSLIFFIIQREDADIFGPNEEMDKFFSMQLKLAKDRGVIIKALLNRVFIQKDSLFIEPIKEIGLNF